MSVGEQSAVGRDGGAVGVFLGELLSRAALYADFPSGGLAGARGREDDPLAVGREGGAVVNAAAFGQLLGVVAVRVYPPEVQAAAAPRLEDDVAPVGRSRGVVFPVGVVGQLPPVRAVGVHDPEV